MKILIVLLSTLFMAAVGSDMYRAPRERDYNDERELPVTDVQPGDAIYYKNKNNFLGQIERGGLSRYMDRRKLHKVIIVRKNTYLWLKYRSDAGMGYEPYGIVVCSGSGRARIVPEEMVKSTNIRSMLASNGESDDTDSSRNDSDSDGEMARTIEDLSI